MTQMYRPLMDALPFLFDISTLCCVGFLTALNIPVDGGQLRAMI